jgi:hypothetical protein
MGNCQPLAGSSVSFMEPNTKGLLPGSFKSLQNKAFIVFNALFDNNVSGSTIKLQEEPEFPIINN